jgi:hypothetical protein
VLLATTLSVGGLGTMYHLALNQGKSLSVATLFQMAPPVMTMIAIVSLGICDSVAIVLLTVVDQAMTMLNKDLDACLKSLKWCVEPGNDLESKAKKSRSFVTEMDTIRIRYVKLCQMAEKVGECFASYLLTTTAWTIMMLVGTSFMLMITLPAAKNGGESLFLLYNGFLFTWFWMRVITYCTAAARPGQTVCRIYF